MPFLRFRVSSPPRNKREEKVKRFPRRAGLAMGLAAIAGITTIAGAGVAQAQVPPCTEVFADIRTRCGGDAVPG
jgi:hypothetical protein